MFEVFLDESGTHSGASVVCVGGFIGEADQWRAFAAEWSTVLHGYGIEFSQYHANRCGDDKLNLQLAELVNKHRLYGVVVSVVRSEFDHEASARYVSQFGGPFAFCA
jgi:hypothetical protein